MPPYIFREQRIPWLAVWQTQAQVGAATYRTLEKGKVGPGPPCKLSCLPPTSVDGNRFTTLSSEQASAGLLEVQKPG